MGFRSFFFGKPMKIGDAFFGEMTFMEISNDPAKSYFECRRYFKPIGEKIGLSVMGTLSGPTQQQKDFFSQIEADYFSLTPCWIGIIEQKLGAWMPWPLIKDFAEEFKPSLIHVPICDQQPYEPQYVRVDG